VNAIVKPCKNGHYSERYAHNRACKECNRERVRRPEVKAQMGACNKRRYLEVRATVLEQQKAYRTTPRGRALQMMQGIVSRSRKRLSDTTLSIEWLEAKLARGVCELSGLPFDLSRDGIKGPYAPSIDRIDSRVGYTPENCRMILWALNTAFSWWGEKAFMDIARAWMDQPPFARTRRNLSMSIGAAGNGNPRLQTRKDKTP
jgi:hypothetical protein